MVNDLIFAFSLYGEKKYLSFASECVKSYLDVFPSCHIVIYHSPEFKNDLLNLFSQNESIYLREVNDVISGISPMSWRFRALKDYTEFNYICIRDIDSLATERECKYLKDWMLSHYPIMTFRDHINHDYPLMGGLIAFKKSIYEIFYSKFTFLLGYKKWKKYEDDEKTLIILYYLFKNQIVAYSSTTIFKGENISMMEAVNLGGAFIGSDFGRKLDYPQVKRKFVSSWIRLCIGSRAYGFLNNRILND